MTIVKLADTEFYKLGKKYVLLGAEVLYDLLCIGQVKAHRNCSIFQKTKFGWIVAGQMPSHSLMSNALCKLSIIKQDINQKLFEIKWNCFGKQKSLHFLKNFS